ncbi:hypothetical protein [Planomicrobium sp. CPCC 101110]|uniref:hypothetical protein n=1 Tax=Planomicrobium sp. CPCC 101110 TaxID=2599619 RepID=UPI00164888A3|nr:hypothetical protein [Planomicrobium sp. CPCC 101110]
MKKTGEESFISKTGDLDIKLLDFWQWNQSDLLNNALRGTLAEFIVGKALDAVTGIRTEWDAFDLVTAEGINVEVKSAAYLQSWQQMKPSTIQFSIRPALAWEASTNTYATEMKRSADVYVFCLLKEQDRSVVNPLNLDQWEFYVLATEQINREKGSQKSIGLNALLRMNPIIVSYKGIKKAVVECISSGNEKL